MRKTSRTASGAASPPRPPDGRARPADARRDGSAPSKDREKARALLLHGNRLLTRRRFQDALDAFEEAARLDRRNAEVHFRLGVAALWLDWVDDAGRHFERALSFDRDHVEALCGRAFVLFKEDNAAEATDCLVDALKLAPHHRLARRVFRELKKTDNIEAFVASLHPRQLVALPGRFLGHSLTANQRNLRLVAVWTIVACVLVLLFVAWRSRLDMGGARSDGTRVTDEYYPASVPADSPLGKRYKAALGARYDDEDPLPPDEASRLLTRLRGLLDGREVNEARYLYNQLAHGRLDDASSAQAEALRRFLKNPERENMTFNPVASDIRERPWLYRGVHVRWLSRVVEVKERAFLQVAPARVHTGDARDLGVVFVGDNLQDLRPGRRVEAFGDVAGVDRAPAGKQSLVFLRLKGLKVIN